MCVCVLLGCMCNDVQKMGSEGYIKRAIVHGVRAAIFAGAIFCQIWIHMSHGDGGVHMAFFWA